MVEEQEPVIDWSKDEDVVSLARITDEQAMKKGWSDDKIAGMFVSGKYCILTACLTKNLH